MIKLRTGHNRLAPHMLRINLYVQIPFMNFGHQSPSLSTLNHNTRIFKCF